ncbi:MAG: dihydroxy-acid dehydratase, partial [Pseudomonadota bacterium]
MGAASANVPAIQLVTGPMLTGSHRGQVVGACTDCRRFWAAYRADDIDADEIQDVNAQLVPGVGTCSVMGTASTMALIAEALGMALPGSATAPAVSAERRRIAEATGARAVALAGAGTRPGDIVDRRAIENALRVLLSIGGSTNGIVHLTAIAGRLGIRIDLEAVDRMARETPVLVNLKPSGSHYMEDLHAAGGLPRILSEIRDLLHLDVPTVGGALLGDTLGSVPDWPQDVVRERAAPVYPEGGLAVLKGNLAPSGAVIKQSAASPSLMVHEGRAVVFTGLEDLANRLDDPDLEVSADDILVLQNIGPKGAPGMPEAGLIPIPRKLARAGVKDMVRISDGRMSGTAAGTIVLHVSPESAAGGTLGLVRSGDRIRLDVANRRLDVLLGASELAARRADLPAHLAEPSRGYRRLYLDEVLQAENGADFAFCQPEMLVTAPSS